MARLLVLGLSVCALRQSAEVIGVCLALRSLGVALLACLAVVLLGSASWAVPIPAPAPTSGAFHAGAWHCIGSTAVGAPDPATGTTGTTAEDCAVTTWASEAVATVPPAGTGMVQLTDDQFSVVGFGFGLLVLLTAAHTVASWRK